MLASHSPAFFRKMAPHETRQFIRSQLSKSLIIRLIVIAATSYFEEGGSHSRPTYTDVDYHVFTDAGALLLSGNSPYKRATYRYPPLIAAVASLNHLVHPAAGKIIFSLADVIAGSLLFQTLDAAGGVSTESASQVSLSLSLSLSCFAIS